MKIIAVGRNYANHAKELNNPIPEEPVIFTKPDTAILKNNEPFYYPTISNDIHHEIEIFVRICKNGKKIQEKFAHNYYNSIGLAIDFTARDLQTKAKEKSLPWALAKGFDHSCPISTTVNIEQYDLGNINFSLLINGKERQQGNTKDMIFSVDALIAYISQYITLRQGDIILTGTPEGVGPVNIGDQLEGFLDGEKLLDFEVR